MKTAKLMFVSLLDVAWHGTNYRTDAVAPAPIVATRDEFLPLLAVDSKARDNRNWAIGYDILDNGWRDDIPLSTYALPSKLRTVKQLTAQVSALLPAWVKPSDVVAKPKYVSVSGNCRALAIYGFVVPALLERGGQKALAEFKVPIVVHDDIATEQDVLRYQLRENAIGEAQTPVTFRDKVRAALSLAPGKQSDLNQYLPVRTDSQRAWYAIEAAKVLGGQKFIDRIVDTLPPQAERKGAYSKGDGPIAASMFKGQNKAALWQVLEQPAKVETLLAAQWKNSGARSPNGETRVPTRVEWESIRLLVEDNCAAVRCVDHVLSNNKTAIVKALLTIKK